MKKSIVMRLVETYRQKEIPFVVILSNGQQSHPSRFLDEDSECLVVESVANQLPAAYNYDDISNLLPATDTSNTVSAFIAVKNTRNNDTHTLPNTIPNSIFEQAKESIWLHVFSPYDRHDEIQEQVHNTPLEKEWNRTNNIILDASKNHVLSEKIESVIAILSKLPSKYDCIELYQMIGAAHALNEDYDNASYYYEYAGDYQNAAYYASKCRENSKEYQIEVFRKWIDSRRGYSKEVLASFFKLSQELHQGKCCAETIRKISVKEQSAEVKNILYLGLIHVLSNYSLSGMSLPASESKDEQIKLLLEQLINHTESESYNPNKVVELKHAQEVFSEPENLTKDVYTGYIIKTWDTHGYIGETAFDTQGTGFRTEGLHKDFALCFKAYHTNMYGLKVAYKIKTLGSKNVAYDIQPAEDLKSFFKDKGINFKEPAENVFPENIPSEKRSAEEKLLPNPDGETYSGYIITVKPGYGFIHKDINTTEDGVYFHSSELDASLKPHLYKLRGLPVNFVLKTSPSKPDQKMAANITAAVDFETFINKQNTDALVNKPSEEVIDENDIADKLSRALPSTVVHQYATTNRPLHALEALERTKDSFPYDKYVKQKIQLLQRTKSSDNELIQLLNYTISTSHEGSYIAHHLFFLGQVQYRCKQYKDVIITMNRLQNYRSYMKLINQYTDSLFLTAISYYMLRDYSNADKYAMQLKEQGAHVDEAQKILDRTFESESRFSNKIDDMDSEAFLQFDTEVAITPYIEKLIDSFSFGSISVEGVPADFDPWSGECSVDLANDYIERLEGYYKSKKVAGKNNPNASIASAKIRKWLTQQLAEKEKEKNESSLRINISRALQIIARNAFQQSRLDLRVHLFYRMQQYKMSVHEQKTKWFNAYVNAHYGAEESVDFSPAKKGGLYIVDHKTMVCNMLLLFGYMDNDEFVEEEEKIKELCQILLSRPDGNTYRIALCDILKVLNIQYNEDEDFYSLVEFGQKAIREWLNNEKKTIREKAESKQWDLLLRSVESLGMTSFLTDYEREYVSDMQEIIGFLISAERNSQTAMKQNYLNQSKNSLEKLAVKLEDTPTFILYNIFADVLGILNSSTLSLLAEAMSHKPEIEAVGSLQINLGLTDSREFILPLEFQNKGPAIQAKNLTIYINRITDGVSLRSDLPIGQNVDEGKKHNASLIFRLDSQDIEQVDIDIRVDYSYDAFDNFTYERQTDSRSFNYTITFQKVEEIENKYRNYAQQQTVKDKLMFFGRDDLIRKLYDAISMKNDAGEDILRGGNGIVLYGQRRSGKSSILYHLNEKIKHDMQRAIIVDLGSSGTSVSKAANQREMTEKELQERNAKTTLQTLYDGIISGIENHIKEYSEENKPIGELAARIRQYELETGKSFFSESNDIASSDNPQLLFNRFLRKFADVARSHDELCGYRIVIFIDEFNYFNEAIQSHNLPSNFMEIWKGIISNSIISLIVAGQDNMIEFMDKYVNEFSSFHREWVTFLAKDASYKMATEPIGKERIDPEAADKLYRFTAGSPFLLMDVCAELVDWMNANKILKLAGSLPEDFLAGKYMQDYNFKQDLLEPQYNDAGRLDWTGDIKLVLGLISRSASKKVTSRSIPWNEFDEYVTIKDDMLENRGISAEHMREILERLVKRQVIEAQEGNQNKFRIKIPLCREWILRRGGKEYGNE